VAPLWPILGTSGPVSAPVPIPNDGRATILNVPGGPAASPMHVRRDYVVNFDQVIPKPFCTAGAPSGFLYVNGPVRFEQQLRLTPSGNFISQFHATGRLELLPVTVSPTIAPAGEPYEALVHERYKVVLTDHVTLVSLFQLQIELPPRGAGRGRLVVTLKLGPGASDVAAMDVRCTP
jgi:hypothetical protein